VEAAAKLWERLQGWYQQHPQSSQLETLGLRSFKLPGEQPRLRGKAAEIRNLVGFAKVLAEEYILGADAFSDGMRTAAAGLVRLYTAMYEGDTNELSCASRTLAGLLVDLEAAAPEGYWKFRPKAHLMQEMCERLAPMGIDPRESWTYRDEDFGGKIAQASATRGGPNTAGRLSRNIIDRFRALQPRSMEPAM
jgi:hypothetical protein